jgi:hypothetical protein
VGYYDSDVVGDIYTSKSTTGATFFLGSNLITWQSQQKVVALSTYEAEYMEATVPTCQGIWLPQLLGELRRKAVSVLN